jgi:predicted enzyme related to lactoylglutathione lyase
MVERTGYIDGEPCWADVIAPDTEASKRFYSTLFGWTYTESGPEFGGYVNCYKDGKAVAGISPPQPGSESNPPVWSLYLWATDADTTARRIEQGGGKLLFGPDEVPGFGRFAFAFDPAGTAFGIWEPMQHRGAQLFGEPGALGWAEINTREPATVDGFYRDLFGYEQEQVGDGDSFDYTVWKLDGETVAGRMKMTADWPDVPSHWMVYFVVDDCDAATERVAEGGGAVQHGPIDSRYGRLAIVADPNGAHFSIIDVTRRSESGPPAT